MTSSTNHPRLHWEENGEAKSALWRSEAGVAPAKRVILADDQTKADEAWRLACEGTALLWCGDFQNARQLLQAMARRIDKKPAKKKRTASMTEAFHQHRMAQAQRARTLGMLLVPLAADYTVPLRRAPEVVDACTEAYGPGTDASVVSLRELQGLVGAHEWRKKGVPIPALEGNIHPHYGVFSPVRGEYIDLIANAPLPVTRLAFDIGTGTGVLAALLARRGVEHIVATDQDPRALRCARENIGQLGLTGQVDVIQANLFPEAQAPLIVCNPPWVPAKPSSPIESAIYDPDSRMLRGFLAGLAAHLTPGGEGWLILSDFAEHLGLRTRAELLTMFEQGGLRIIQRHDIRPKHPKSADITDPLHLARVSELTSLWRLAAA